MPRVGLRFLPGDLDRLVMRYHFKMKYLEKELDDGPLEWRRDRVAQVAKERDDLLKRLREYQMTSWIRRFLRREVTVYRIADVTADSLQVQLVQLNERSRAYTARLWQIPFAYLTVTAALVVGIGFKAPGVQVWALYGSFGFGILIFVQRWGLADGVRRAVEGTGNRECAAL